MVAVHIGFTVGDWDRGAMEMNEREGQRRISVVGEGE